jgi:hypothetical protein
LGEEQPGAFHENLVKRRERARALRGKGRGARRCGRLSLNGRGRRPRRPVEIPGGSRRL